MFLLVRGFMQQPGEASINLLPEFISFPMPTSRVQRDAGRVPAKELMYTISRPADLMIFAEGDLVEVRHVCTCL